MIGWNFTGFQSSSEGKAPFEQLLDIFKELLLHTSGNVREALSWLTQLDKQYKLTDPSYGVADFIQDLIDKGYIGQQDQASGGKFVPTSKMEIALRRKALDDIFDQLKKSKRGQHITKNPGQGDEFTSEMRPYVFGDKLDNIAISETIKNAHINHGIDDFKITHDDLTVHETFFQSQTSTVLMIDISHSMILYGEDRITPAKKVAMALSELIITKYPKDTLDIIVFGDDAWEVQIKDLPYLEVGPYHTNTVAGLELAMEILRKRKNPNKQIMMITDGKPTCIKKGKKYFKNSFGLDRSIVNRTLALAVRCKKMHIPVTTFMIARDPYLVNFVDQFTMANGGKAFYSSLQGLGEFVFMDYKTNKRKLKR
ncbi:MAG: VWA domain-containing protein [Saprospiraceae bacterium]|nr:VWA domain-containing protein [Saprospiraceae bacterium]